MKPMVEMVAALFASSASDDAVAAAAVRIVVALAFASSHFDDRLQAEHGADRDADDADAADDEPDGALRGAVAPPCRPSSAPPGLRRPRRPRPRARGSRRASNRRSAPTSMVCENFCFPGRRSFDDVAARIDRDGEAELGGLDGLAVAGDGERARVARARRDLDGQARELGLEGLGLLRREIFAILRAGGARERNRLAVFGPGARGLYRPARNTRRDSSSVPMPGSSFWLA